MIRKTILRPSVAGVGRFKVGRYSVVFLSCLFFLGGLSSCFTGVEGTKKIELSRADRKSVEISPERRLMDSLISIPLSDWKAGKEFLVTDNRLAVLLTPREVAPLTPADSLMGRILCFQDYSSVPLPDGSEGTALTFSLNGVDYVYTVSRSPEAASKSIRGGEMPMLIDLDMVRQADSLLAGRKVWTRTRLWYAPDGVRQTGRKFVPVTIDSVVTGNSVFPLIVCFSNEEGREATMLMNYGVSGVESRTFDTLFSLSDPRGRYPGIDSEVWELITNGKVRLGMTKEECRLSVGSPVDVTGGRDWNKTLDIWKYSDGRYLVFTDGLLSEYRL
ncbi:MAG: hypothetical protein HDS82_00500 [Bacteroidales bacterium]|nr:hypothetical protein [Bacteroidales bacterium]